MSRRPSGGAVARGVRPLLLALCLASLAGSRRAHDFPALTAPVNDFAERHRRRPAPRASTG